MNRVRRSASSALLLTVVLAGCDFITDPGFPGQAQPFNPPAVYGIWWEMIESCAGRQGPFEDIEWFVVPGSRSFAFRGKAVAAAWFRSRNDIVVVSDGVLEGPLIRHEMLHALLGRGEHPRREFLNLCGGVVSCAQDCIHDAGAAPAIPASTPRVPPSFLGLTVSVDPPTPRASVLDGYFSVTVRVRNPTAHPVVVELPPPGDDGPPVSFSYRLFRQFSGFFYSDRAWDNSVRMFNAGETKLMVYDFFAGGDIHDGKLPLGEYSLEVAYGQRWSPAMAITLAP